MPLMLVDGAVMRQTAHRPWPLPDGRWVMAQTWHDLLFAHWPVPKVSLEGLIPPPLTLDTFDGRAWVGVVPFHMTGVRLRGLPPLPGVSAFAEINLRTYVTLGGKPGVFFFSLDAANALAVAAARRWYRLPYFRARISAVTDHGRTRYRSLRTHRHAPPAAFIAEYAPIGDVVPAQRGTLERWLTERYCLYAFDRRQRVYRGEIHHAPWPLQPAEAEIERNTMARPHKIALPGAAPLLHFSRRLDVRIWPLRRVEAP